MSAAWFVGRSQWRRRWLGLIGLGIVGGVIAGVVMASVAGIRRTSTSLERLIDAGRTAHVSVHTPVGADVTEIATRLSAVPGVEKATPVVPLVGREAVDKNWWQVTAPVREDGSAPVLVEGRLPAANAPDEVIVSRHTADTFALDVGSRLDVAFYSPDQFVVIDVDSSVEPAGPHPDLAVVGVYLDRRDAEQSATATAVRGGPAFAAAYGENATIEIVSVSVDDVDRRLPALQAEVAALNEQYGFSDRDGNAITVADDLAAAVESEKRSRAVVSGGLLAFAAAAFLAGVVAHGQALRRWFSRLDATQSTLFALGASRRDRRAALAIAAAPHIVIATGVSIATAYLLSGLFPIGVLRKIEPTPGLRADEVVFTAGAVVTAVVLAGLTLAVTVIAARRGVTRRAEGSEAAIVKLAEQAGAPLPASVGVRFAARPGRARLVLTVRTALTATVVAFGGVVAASVFTSSLHRLATTPARYGVPWDVSLELLSAPDGPQALDALVADPRVADVGVVSIDPSAVRVDDLPTEVTVVTTRKGATQLAIASGRAPQGPSEVALGPRLLHDLGKGLGDTVEVTSPDGTTMAETVVGTAYSLEFQSESFNTGAFFVDDGSTSKPSGFAVVVVRFAPGVDVAEMVREIDQRHPYAVMNESFAAAPPEVQNLAQLSTLPTALGAFLTFLGVAALTHALVVTVSARRRDLGVLRTLGFTGVQTAGAVMAMTTTIVVAGALVGIPFGLLVGSTGWRVVARGIFVATDSRVPSGAVILSCVVGVALAYLIAGVPARRAARLDAGAALRSE